MKIKFLNGTEKEFESLVGANLLGADLSGVELSRANLSEANLSWANLSRANLFRADLSGANLSRANLFEANLRRANLFEANLRRANLREANLWNTLGDNNELQTIMLGTYIINIWKDVMQIGCERHTTNDWFGFTDNQINGMDKGALEWWTKWKDVIRQIIDEREWKDDE